MACGTTGDTTPSVSLRRIRTIWAITGFNSFKVFVQQMHDADIEVILDVVFNHTAEGNRFGPTLSFRGIDNRSYYHLVEGEERFCNDFHGDRKRASAQAPLCAAHGHGQPCATGCRRWGSTDSASTSRRPLARVDGVYDEHASFLDAIAQDPVLSRGQADRRTVGYRRRRLSGRQLPARLGRMERPVPRYGAPVLEGRRRPGRDVRHPLFGFGRHLRPAWPTHLVEHQFRHRPRRIHPQRPCQLQRQAQPGQQRGQPRRFRQQQQLEQR